MALIRVQSSPVVISQSTMIVGAILAFFILWLAANGKLATYWTLLMGKGTSGGSSSGGGGTGGSSSGFSPTVPFSSDWWNNFLRPWGLAK